MAEVINVQAPDQAPVEAPSLTQFADLEKTPQANTTILPNADNLNKDLLGAAVQRHAWQEADYQRQQKAISDRIDKMNINTAGTWEVDIPEIQGEVNDYLDYVGKHPELEEPTAKNLKDYTALQQRKNQILSDIDKSKQDKAYSLEQHKFLQEHADQAWNTDENQGILGDYDKFNQAGGKSLRDRQRVDFKRPDTYNPITIAGKVATDLGTVENSYETPTGQGSQTRSVKVKEVPLTGDKSVEQGLNAIKNTPQDYQDLVRHYTLVKGDILSGKQQDKAIPVYDLKAGFDKNGQPKILKTEKLSEASMDDILNSEYVSLLHKREVQQGLQGDATKGENKEANELGWIVDNIAPFANSDTQNPPVGFDEVAKVASGGSPTIYPSTTALKGFKTQDGEEVATIKKIGNVTLLEDKDGNDIGQVKNYWDDVIVPYVKQSKGVTADKYLDGLEKYANDNYPEQAKSLGIPQKPSKQVLPDKTHNEYTHPSNKKDPLGIL